MRFDILKRTETRSCSNSLNCGLTSPFSSPAINLCIYNNMKWIYFSKFIASCYNLWTLSLVYGRNERRKKLLLHVMKSHYPTINMLPIMWNLQLHNNDKNTHIQYGRISQRNSSARVLLRVQSN